MKALSSLLSSPPSLHIEQVGSDKLAMISALNRTIFGEERIINRLDRRDLVMLVAYSDEEPVGFKVGYGENRSVFYSAKGGVLASHRRLGIARHLLHEMISLARTKGYRCFAFDTFPNRHPGMTVLGLAEGFRLTAADFNTVYQDYRLRFEKDL